MAFLYIMGCLIIVCANIRVVPDALLLIVTSAYTVVPLKDLEKETVAWCREMLCHSPIALRCMKAALNADCDGQTGLQELAGDATMLFYMTEEGQEGRNAFNEKRKPDFSKFKRNP